MKPTLFRPFSTNNRFAIINKCQNVAVILAIFVTQSCDQHIFQFPTADCLCNMMLTTVQSLLSYIYGHIGFPKCTTENEEVKQLNWVKQEHVSTSTKKTMQGDNER